LGATGEVVAGLELRSTPEGDIAILAVTGSVRRNRLPAVLRVFGEALRNSSGGVVIDLSRATRLTSAALAMVIYGQKLFHAGGARLVVVKPLTESDSRLPGRMLEQLFDCRDTLGEAVAVLRAGHPAGHGDDD
jgi:anti-anti-sigma regulatory factor